MEYRWLFNLPWSTENASQWVRLLNQNLSWQKQQSLTNWCDRCLKGFSFCNALFLSKNFLKFLYNLCYCLCISYFRSWFMKINIYKLLLIAFSCAWHVAVPWWIFKWYAFIDICFLTLCLHLSVEGRSLGDFRRHLLTTSLIRFHWVATRHIFLALLSGRSIFDTLLVVKLPQCLFVAEIFFILFQMWYRIHIYQTK